MKERTLGRLWKQYLEVRAELRALDRGDWKARLACWSVAPDGSGTGSW